MINVSIPKIESIVIDADELHRLRAAKLINTNLFVYFAIQISFNSSNPSIDIATFTNMWSITTDEFYSAIAWMEKKSQIQTSPQQLEIKFIYDQD